MVKREGDITENTQIEDLDAFEEFESGPEVEPHQVPVGDRLVDASEPMADDFAFENFESNESPSVPTEIPVSSHEPMEPPRTVADEFADSLMSLAPDLPVNLTAVIGKTSTTVADLLKVRVGQVMDLGRPPSETVDVVANGRLIARGELVDMDGSLGVRILKMVR